jgi:large subunit ribosomal protein L25
MSDKVIFHVESRKKSDKSNKLRKMGRIPANVYGLSAESQSLTVDLVGFTKLYDNSGDTGLVYLVVDKQKEQPVLIDSVDYNSVTGTIIHAAFKRVDLNETVTAMIPIELVGENKISDTFVALVKDEVEVEALPANFPDKFEVDISTLTEIGQTVTLADLAYDKSKVTLVLDEGVNPAEEAVVILQRVEEEVEEAPAATEGEANPEATDAGTESEPATDTTPEA